MRALLGGGFALLLSACAVVPPPLEEEPRRKTARVVPAQRSNPPVYVPGAAPRGEKDSAPDASEVPENISQIPDAVPQLEPRARSGNAPVYEVLGRTYRVLDTAEGFRERGHASWYGKKFHGRKTASGEIYDMYAMTAAHKNLPLPSYVRVTNLANGKSAIVRVNDRGPFHRGRVIDLSYAAAAKLDMLKAGSTPVEIEALVPDDSGTMVAALTPATPPSDSGVTAELSPGPLVPRGFLQVASFIDPINAIAFREELVRLGFTQASIVQSESGGEVLHRVVLGPFPTEAAAAALREQLRGQGYRTDWVMSSR